jgi:hypothetical protein
MMMSPGSSSGTSWSITASTAAPALTMIMTRRGRWSFAHQLLQRVRAEDALALRAAGEEFVHLRGGAVVGHHGEAVVGHVEDEVLAHDGESDDGRCRQLRCSCVLSLSNFVEPLITQIARMEDYP